MVLQKSLTKEEAAIVREDKIYRFYKSDLGQRLLAAYKKDEIVRRELPFFTYISSREINPNLSKDDYENELVRLQGIIDGFFVEDGEIILFDYKTDYVEAGKEEEIVERYKIQMKYYKEALQKITGLKIKEIYLYLFYINKPVKVEI